MRVVEVDPWWDWMSVVKLTYMVAEAPDGVTGLPFVLIVHHGLRWPHDAVSPIPFTTGSADNSNEKPRWIEFNHPFSSLAWNPPYPYAVFLGIHATWSACILFIVIRR